MNVIFLSPSFPPSYYHFCHHLRALGINVLGIDQTPREELTEDLRRSLTDYYKVSDLHHYQELVRACEYFIHRHGPIDRIESHNEHWLKTQANLAAQFGIPGIKPDDVNSFQRKSEMKKIFQTAGLNPAKGELVPTLEDALNAGGRLGYPVILKPDIGVGASGCKKIHNEHELRDFFHHKPHQDYLMEEFIYGDVCTFDGLTDRNGTPIFCTSHVYNAGIADIVHQQLDQYYFSCRDIPSDVEMMGRKTLEAYRVKERFFHFEYFRTHKDKSLVPIEVNMRPPGTPTLDMCNYACDINLYKEWAHVIAGIPSGFSYDRKYHSIAITRRDKHSYVYSHQQVLEECSKWIVHHEPLPPIFSGTMGEYYYLARSSQLDELLHLQQRIQQKH